MEFIIIKILEIFIAYLLSGILFGLLFITIGIKRIDSVAKGSSIPFRLMILPGVCLLWPLLALRWWKRNHKPSIEKHEIHRRLAN